MTAPSKHKHVMVDIETLGKGHGAAILSIGAVPFSLHRDRLEIGPIETWFHERATLQSNADAGRNIDPETIEWWLGQSKEAQQALLLEPRHDLPVLLESFLRWITRSPGLKAECLWAKPPHFDIAIIQSAFEQAGIEWPFHFGVTRDVRTILETAKTMNWSDVTRHEFEGEKHNAAHDAAHQAAQVIIFHGKLFELEGGVQAAQDESATRRRTIKNQTREIKRWQGLADFVRRTYEAAVDEDERPSTYSKIVKEWPDLRPIEATVQVEVDPEALRRQE